jgi:RNA polymerase sigma factor (TIGR02999 family)
MEGPEPAVVTGLLKAWTGGDQAALGRLIPLVYDELRRMARKRMRQERAGNTLQTTALVNEVYLRLVDVGNVDWQHRAQFFAISSQIMRRILVDTAGARGSRMRGGGAEKSTWTTWPSSRPSPESRSWPWMLHWTLLRK